MVDVTNKKTADTVAKIQVDFNGDHSQGLYISGFSVLPEQADRIEIDADNVITLKKGSGFEYLQFSPNQSDPVDCETYRMKYFKFLGLCVVDDTDDANNVAEWRPPVFGKKKCTSKNDPQLHWYISTMTAFLEPKKDTREHDFSIIYYQSLNAGTLGGSASVRVFDPGIRDQD
ncbi:MAG: hypothetical protein DHS20C12_20880 [Pseudohongiella sp.]|nr:MAG: hypothetical protein DHS20C12_20880 [Pseudohongiella sp.]